MAASLNIGRTSSLLLPGCGRLFSPTLVCLHCYVRNPFIFQLHGPESRSYCVCECKEDGDQRYHLEQDLRHAKAMWISLAAMLLNDAEAGHCLPRVPCLVLFDPLIPLSLIPVLQLKVTRMSSRSRIPPCNITSARATLVEPRHESPCMPMKTSVPTPGMRFRGMYIR